MSHPSGQPDTKAISDTGNNDDNIAMVNSVPETKVRDNPAKRHCQLGTTDDMEGLDQDGLALVRNKKKSKTSAVGSASAQDSITMDGQDNSAVRTTYRLVFPKSVKPRDNNVASGVATYQCNQELQPSRSWQ